MNILPTLSPRQGSASASSLPHLAPLDKSHDSTLTVESHVYWLATHNATRTALPSMALPCWAYPDAMSATVTLPLSLCQFESFTLPEPDSCYSSLIGVPRPLLCGNLACAFGGFTVKGEPCRRCVARR